MDQELASSDSSKGAASRTAAGAGCLRLLTGWAPQTALREFGVRFQGIVHLGNVITCTGTVVEKLERAGERLVRIELQATNQYGERKTAGEALVALGG